MRKVYPKKRTQPPYIRRPNELNGVIANLFMNYFKQGLLVLILSYISFDSLSQGIVRGFIKDKEKGEPVLFITIGLEGTTFGTKTDENGFYSLSKIPEGTYTLFIPGVDYREVRDTILIKNGSVLSRNFLLEKNEIMLNEVTISSEGSDQRNNVNISVKSIRSQDIKRLPSIGGQPDLAQVLTTLPGFVSTGDQGGQIYIRGGSPVQNKVLLDGMIIYNPFHSIGLFSVFDTDIIANADIYTGGFNAQFGGRISSVMDITTRDGNKVQTNGRVGVNPFGIRAQIDGPIKKLSDKGSGISYVLSAKRSYLDQSSPKLYPYVNDGDGLPFNYTDVYGKVSFSGSNGSKFNVFGFSFNDAVTNYQNLANLSWGNNGFGANFVVLPSTSDVLINGNFALSRYDIILSEENTPDRKSGIGSFNGGLDFKYVIKDDVLRYGVEVVGFTTDYSTFSLLNSSEKVEYTQNTTELNAFVDYKFNRKRWVIEPSLRIQYYGTLSVISPEPRLGMKFKASERLRFKLATGLYTQNLMATNSDRDVVNLFYGFLAGPENLQSTFVTPNFKERQVRNVLQTAIHYIAGFEFDLTERWNLNVEGYYRDFRQLTNTNRTKVFEDNAANQDKPESQRKEFVVESGWAAGCDIVAKYEDKNYYFWLVYSLGKVRRWDGYNWYAPVFDRRHNVNFVGAYKFGKDKSYELSVRWNLGSGLPFTQTQGYYQPQGVQGGISLDYLTNNSNLLAVQYGTLNGGRLPYYHRLDFNVRKSVKLSNRLNLEMNAGVTNVYNRANVFYIDRITGRRVDQLPILPTIGVDLSF